MGWRAHCAPRGARPGAAGGSSSGAGITTVRHCALVVRFELELLPDLRCAGAFSRSVSSIKADEPSAAAATGCWQQGQHDKEQRGGAGSR